jgi:hypothetical protein
MTIKEILKWLKGMVECPVWRASRQDMSAEKSITIYEQEAPEIAPGASYSGKHIMAIVHWGTGAAEAEAKAQELYDSIVDFYGVAMGHEAFAIMLESGPAYIGTLNGQIEYKIEFNIYYAK